MFTRCPACAALFELTPGELAEAAGVVRCSGCGKTFNSLANLFDRQPDADEPPLRGQGMPPVLGHRVALQHDLPGLDDPEADDAAIEHSMTDNDSARGDSIEDLVLPPPNRAFWPAAVAVLTLVALAQGLWLLGIPQAWLDPSAGPAAIRQPATAVVMVGRDLHPHPTLDDAVVISALLRNQSTVTVDFPVIELRLFDQSSQLLGVRRLHPEDYLAHPSRAPSGLPPGALLPLIAEVAVTGSEPTGFELRFF